MLGLKICLTGPMDHQNGEILYSLKELDHHFKWIINHVSY